MGLAIGSKRRRWRSENADEPDPKEQVKFKLALVRLAVLIAFGALTLQLARLQLIRGAEFEQRAEAA